MDNGKTHVKNQVNKTENTTKSLFSNFLELRNNIIRESLDDVGSTGHRLEFIRNVNGVDFINDSKATNVDLAWYSLETINNPVIWIVGGAEEAADYSMLQEIVSDKVKVIICLGKDCKKIFRTFMSEVEMIIGVNSAEEAAKMALSVAKTGDTVLLSPACTSFDMFDSFEDRGNKFKQAVMNLEEK